MEVVEIRPVRGEFHQDATNRLADSRGDLDQTRAPGARLAFTNWYDTTNHMSHPGCDFGYLHVAPHPAAGTWFNDHDLPYMARGIIEAVPEAPPPRDEHHRRRLQRRKFLKNRKGKRLYARRGQTVAPFHDWFKALFELDQQVWHRGLDNNRTQLLAALFAYQLLVRYNHRRGNEKGQVKWIMDCL